MGLTKSKPITENEQKEIQSIQRQINEIYHLPYNPENIAKIYLLQNKIDDINECVKNEMKYLNK